MSTIAVACRQEVFYSVSFRFKCHEAIVCYREVVLYPSESPADGRAQSESSCGGAPYLDGAINA